MSDRVHLPLALQGVGFEIGGRRLLDGIDLMIAARGRTLLLGPNGAGKSLLLRLCHGLILPTLGAIASRSGRPGIAHVVRARQAMVFQRPVMLRRSALANVAYGLEVRGVAHAAAALRARAALDRFGLAALAQRPARVLSGGEQQRVALARAWALEPELLILDEPTSALDPAATRAVEEAILAFSAAGTTILMSTHDLGQARRLADHIVFLCRGRLLETGPAASFFAAPQTAQARAFLAGDLVV